MHIVGLLLQKEGTYNGKKFNAICHFFGYQARGALPSKFDCDYGYVGLSSLSLFSSENCYAVKSPLNCFVLGSWTFMLSHHRSWFERLHGHCDQP